MNIFEICLIKHDYTPNLFANRSSDATQERVFTVLVDKLRNASMPLFFTPLKLLDNIHKSAKNGK